MDPDFAQIAAAIVRADMMICSLADLVPYIIIGAAMIVGGLIIVWHCTKD